MAFRYFRVRERWALSTRRLAEPDEDRPIAPPRGPRQLTADERERAYKHAREHRISMSAAVRELFED